MTFLQKIQLWTRPHKVAPAFQDYSLLFFPDLLSLEANRGKQLVNKSLYKNFLSSYDATTRIFTTKVEIIILEAKNHKALSSI
ncbi:hypothetical protein TNCT_511211 [Trichonephila clavata]|uniref:Uncharacterized protein n=1 Tax=Trichonephila clavata TaxID=2740835 RepID=A0A8X6J6E7_TRICU|nr:hypothetical protein TNCT_511211 [Trichonephila clavata]